jgi:hypothetical protein
MTPESQRIAIAEVCGYRKGESKPLWWARPSGQPFKACGIKDLPDYLNDLNAMHEAEKVLGEPLCYAYVDQLPRHYSGRTNFALAHATAAQRAEAFLRTLNLWKDDE